MPKPTSLHWVIRTPAGVLYSGTADKEPIFGSEPTLFDDQEAANTRAKGLREAGYAVNVEPYSNA